MITEIAFVGSPVTDIKRARAFYEGVLGLRCTTSDPEAKWVEFEGGSGTCGIGDYGDQWRPAHGGTMAAFETDNLQEMVQRVRDSGATVAMDVTESPVCHFAMVLDPFGNTL